MNEGLLFAAVLVVAVGVAAAIGYVWGSKEATKNAEVIISGSGLELPLKDQNLLFPERFGEPIPEGFDPKKDGGKELDDPVPLVQVEPSYYAYDENGDATGEPREEFRLGD